MIIRELLEKLNNLPDWTKDVEIEAHTNKGEFEIQDVFSTSTSAPYLFLKIKKEYL